MKDLEQDMYKVVVEGEVTVLNHRELKKRGAWIISFDMTDHTGSAVSTALWRQPGQADLRGRPGSQRKEKEARLLAPGPREGDGQPLRR